MRLAAIIAFVRRWAVLLAAAAALVGLLTWRYFHPPLAERLLAHLPAGQALYLVIDGDTIGKSETLTEIFRTKLLDAPGYAEFAAATGIDFGEDFRGAIFTLGGAASQMVIEGHFPDYVLQRYLESQGAICGESLRREPCVWQRQQAGLVTELRMLGDGQLGIATAPTREQLPKFEGPGAIGAAEVAERAERSPVAGSAAWIFIDPPALEAAMQDPPPGWVNLTLFARALAAAREAFVIISEAQSELGGGEMHILLRAECSSAAEAEQLQSLLASLNRFAAAALNMGKSEQERSPWSAVLSDSRFVQAGATVEGLWIVPFPLLMQAPWPLPEP